MGVDRSKPMVSSDHAKIKQPLIVSLNDRSDCSIVLKLECSKIQPLFPSIPTLKIHRNLFDKITSPFAVMLCEITEDNFSVPEITRGPVFQTSQKVA